MRYAILIRTLYIKFSVHGHLFVREGSRNARLFFHSSFIGFLLPLIIILCVAGTMTKKSEEVGPGATEDLPRQR